MKFCALALSACLLASCGPDHQEPKKVVIHQGAWLTCDRTGAKVARVSHDVFEGDVMSIDVFTDWRFPVAQIGQVGQCPDGSQYIKTGFFAYENEGFHSIQGRIVMHFADGWR